MLIKKNFVNFLVRIMPDNESKANVDSLLYNGTYLFTYDGKTIESEQFPDLEIFYVNNFQVYTSVAIEMQLQSWNFKLKGANKVTHRYFFKLVCFYHIKNI